MKNKYYEVISEIANNGYFLVTNEKVLFHYNNKIINFKSTDEAYFNNSFFKAAYCKEYGEENYSVKKALTIIKRSMCVISQTLIQKLICENSTVRVFKNVTISKEVKTSPSVDFSVTVLEARANEVHLKTLKFEELPEYCWGFNHTKNVNAIHILKHGIIDTVKDMSVITHNPFNPFKRYSSSYNLSHSYNVTFNTGKSQTYLPDSVITIFIG